MGGRGGGKGGKVRFPFLVDLRRIGSVRYRLVC